MTRDDDACKPGRSEKPMTRQLTLAGIAALNHRPLTPEYQGFVQKDDVLVPQLTFKVAVALTYLESNGECMLSVTSILVNHLIQTSPFPLQ